MRVRRLTPYDRIPQLDTVNHALTAVFDAVLGPIERLGEPVALVVASAVFGVLALLAFKRLSAQRRIKAVKNRIKGHLIEIRIYQDDLAVVARAVGKVLLRNVEYLAYNAVSFLPLAIPFVFVLAQLVVRYAYGPVPVGDESARVLPGQGTTITVELDRDRSALVSDLSIVYPEGIVALSPLVRSPSDGRAFQEVIATRPGTYEIAFELPGGERATKRIAAGEPARAMQPARGRGLLDAVLWPAEDALPAESPFARIAFVYPERDLGWLPGGAGGVVVVFLVASMAAGIAVLKPLGIEV